jgi:hypothetical protein
MSFFLWVDEFVGGIGLSDNVEEIIKHGYYHVDGDDGGGVLTIASGWCAA